MRSNFNTIVVVTPADYLRVRTNLKRLIEKIECNKIIFIGNDEVGKYVESEMLSEHLGFINENDILPFEKVKAVLADILQVEPPRGIVGWYYQQFLKMKYADYCDNEYYMTWDGDTVPVRDVVMFSENSQKPFFDMKHEYHEEYFITLKNLLGITKSVEKSFISEHMIFSKEIMKDLIYRIESTSDLRGNLFFEKILYAIRPSEIRKNSFSEFETYGTYVTYFYCNRYAMREWHSLRYGAMYFIPADMTEEDYAWLAINFDAISFEKNEEYVPEFGAIVKSSEYRRKLTPRQIVEVIQDCSYDEEGFKEVWDEKVEDIDEKDEMETDLIPYPVQTDEYLFYNYFGDAVRNVNLRMAYLYYENAYFLCRDVNAKNALKNKMKEIDDIGGAPRKTAIVILTHNELYLTKQCISSIRKSTSKDMCRIIVVDNNSNDGTKEWLLKQEDITTLLQGENLGFPKGCNVGIEYAEPDEDILLLNNDTRLSKNSLFWLRVGLYSDKKNGAIGSISNYTGIDQCLDMFFPMPSEYVDYGNNNNVYSDNMYEEKTRLSGYAMLISRDALDVVGRLDEKFSPGYFEDDDLSIRIRENGFRIFLCHSSFVYHVGSQSFAKREDTKSIFLENKNKLEKKYAFDHFHYDFVSQKEKDILNKLPKNKGTAFTFLEIGAGTGNMLSKVKFYYPYANTFGVENSEDAVRYAVPNTNIVVCDFMQEKMPYPSLFFDYIVINLRGLVIDENVVWKQINPYLKSDGQYFIV